MKRTGTFYYLSLIALTVLPALFSACKTNAGKNHNKTNPNILFILVDDLGKEWVSTYGADDVRTPNADKLAATGMTFRNAYSMPQCTPSRVALLTGQYPWRNGWINHYDVPRWGHGAQFDPEKYITFARVMKSAGYVTCAAGKWQINDFRIQPDIMVQHGFDEYCMWTGGEGGNVKVSNRRYWNPYIHTREGSKTYPGKFGDDIFTDFIITFMKKHRDQPMMIYYPMCLTHVPFTTTPLEPDVKGKTEKHKAMVRYADFLLGKLIASLDSLGIRENTIVFWTTDNGTTHSMTGHRNGWAIRGGKTYLTENGINAPFIVNCPGTVPGGKITDALVDFPDMLPTFAELGGANIPEGDTIDGKSFAPLILGEKDDSPRKWIMALGSHPSSIRNDRVVNYFPFRDRVIRDKKYKAYIDTTKVIYELYDLSSDPGERNNLLNSDVPEVKKALGKFNEVLQTLPEEDANPKYTKLKKSFYDIPVNALNRLSKKESREPNKSPGPYYETNKKIKYHE